MSGKQGRVAATEPLDPGSFETARKFSGNRTRVLAGPVARGRAGKMGSLVKAAVVSLTFEITANYTEIRPRTRFSQVGKFRLGIGSRHNPTDLTDVLWAWALHCFFGSMARGSVPWGIHSTAGRCPFLKEHIR